MRKLTDQIWVVTGASEGIGRAVARKAASAGAHVVLAARSADRLEEVATEIRTDVDVEALAVPTDVTDPRQCRTLADRAVAELGGIDVLVVNAGVTMHADFEETDAEVHRRLMAVNYFGALDTIRAALPALRERRGVIAAVSSIAGLRGFPTRTGYSASKFALRGLTEALRVELAPEGVHVALISPGYVDTGIRTHALGPDGRPLGSGAPVVGGAISAERCAEAILGAVRRRRRHVVLTPVSKIVHWVNRFAPGLLDRFLIAAYRRGRI